MTTIHCAFKPDEDYTCNVRGCVVCQLLKDKTRKEIDRLNRGRKKLDELIPKTTKQINQQLSLSLTLVDARMKVAKLLRKRQGLDEQLISIEKRLDKCNKILGTRIEVLNDTFDLKSGKFIPGLLLSATCVEPATIPDEFELATKKLPPIDKKHPHLRTLEFYLIPDDIPYILKEMYKFKNYSAFLIDAARRVFIATPHQFANAVEDTDIGYHLTGKVIQEGKGEICPIFAKSITYSIVSIIRRQLYYYCVEHDLENDIYTGYCPKLQAVRCSSASESNVHDLVKDGIMLHSRQSLNSTY